MTAQLLIDLIGKTIWPALIFIIVIIFRKPLKMVLERIKSAEGLGIKIALKEMEAKMETKIETKIEEVNDSITFKQKGTPENIKNIIFQHAQEQEVQQPQIEAADDGSATMLVFTANQSFEENLTYNIYYDPVDRSHNFPFKYIGLYKEGEVFAVGKKTKLVSCDLTSTGELVATHDDNLDILRADEKQRIIDTIKNTPYYELEEGCKFFLVDEFIHPISFRKASDYGLRAKKYFDLNDIPGFRKGMSGKELAKLLDGKEWE